MAQVRSVLTAQVLALTEHVSALTKQFTLFQFEQRQQQLASGPLPPHKPLPHSAANAEADRRAALCSVYIAHCAAVQCKPSGSVLVALTTGARPGRTLCPHPARTLSTPVRSRSLIVKHRARCGL